jgi:ribosomal-protein-alanine N-acetyltransferase
METIKDTMSIRWMGRKDLDSVLSIESQVFEFPWGEKELIQTLRCANVVGMVVTDRDRVIGYFIYSLHKRHLELLNFAVHPGYQRRGVGRRIIEKLAGKLSPKRRTQIHVLVRESNLQAQLFLRAHYFRSVAIVDRPFDDSDESAYRFVYRLFDFGRE